METYIPHHFYTLLLRQLPVLSGDLKILDVGCGEGLLTRELAIRYQEAAILGIDKHFKAIQRCRYLASVENLPIDYHIANIEHYKFSSKEKFDLITCHNVLAHSEQPRLVLRKLVEQLKPGGQLSLVVENPAAKAIEQSFRTEGVEWSRFADDPERLLELFEPFDSLIGQTIKKQVDARVLHPFTEIESWLSDVEIQVRGLSVFMDYCEGVSGEEGLQIQLEETLSRKTEFKKFAYFYHVLVQID